MKVLALNDSTVVQLPYTTGDTIHQGDIIAWTEMMKMQVEYTAPITGVITYHVKENDWVYANTLLAEIKESE